MYLTIKGKILIHQKSPLKGTIMLQNGKTIITTHTSYKCSEHIKNP